MPRETGAAKSLRIGVVGATGLVGRELLALLEARNFPAGELRPFSSGRRRQSVPFRGRRLQAPGIDEKALASCDLVFFVSADEVSLRLAPRLSARGIWVIDDSSAFRLDPKVPLVIPEVNAHALLPSKRLIAGPNCTMAPIAVAGLALQRAVGVLELRAASYQAVAGAGREALEEFFSQNRLQSRRLKGGGPAPVLPQARCSALPQPIAFNVFPQVGRFGRDGYSSEELKVASELRKVWEAPNLRVSVTAVRVPAIRGHSLAAWVALRRPLSPARAQALIAGTPGVCLSREGDYPTPLRAAGKWPVFVGRIRAGAHSREICLWIVADSLLKGAALNSIQIAEILLRRGWLRSP